MPTEGDFSTTVNIVDDYGADPTGQTSISTALTQALQNDTLVVFPEGDYLLDSMVLPSGTWGIVGDYTTRRPRLVAPAGYNNWFINQHGGGGILIKDIDIDITANNCVAGFNLYPDVDLHVENLECHGRGEHTDPEETNFFSVGIGNSSGYGLLKNVVSRTGSNWYGYKGGDGRTGFGSYQGHNGTLHFVDCALEEFGNNGFYASRNAGNIQIDGGEFWNNNASNIRISGDGSYADGCTVGYDDARYTGPRATPSSAFSARDLIEEIKTDVPSLDKPPGVEFRNITLRHGETAANTHTAVSSYYSGKTMLVSNCDIQFDVPGSTAIIGEGRYTGEVRPPSGYPRWMHFENTTVRGSGSRAFSLQDRTDSTLQDCCVEFDGDGINATGTTTCNVTGGIFNVTGATTTGDASGDVTFTTVSFTGSCPPPAGASVTAATATALTSTEHPGWLDAGASTAAAATPTASTETVELAGVGKTTPVHEYYLPNSEESGWGAEKNSDWADLDVEVPLRGALSERPAAGTSGRTYLATDAASPTWSLDTGTQWTAANTDAATVAARRFVEHLVDSPNATLTHMALDDGDAAEVSVPVAAGETLSVFRWGAYQIADGTAPTGLDCELLDGSDTVVASEHTVDSEDTQTPVASDTNDTGATAIYKLSAANDTGAPISDPGVGAFFAYVVE